MLNKNIQYRLCWIGLLFVLLLLIVFLCLNNRDVSAARKKLNHICESYGVTDVSIELHYSGTRKNEDSRVGYYHCVLTGNGLDQQDPETVYDCITSLSHIAVGGKKIDSVYTIDGNTYDIEDDAQGNRDGILLKDGETYYELSEAFSSDEENSLDVSAAEDEMQTSEQKMTEAENEDASEMISE